MLISVTRRSLLAPVAALAVLSLSACSSRLSSPETLFGLIQPYQIDVVQGNVVTQEIMAQIQPGLGRTQVREILGSPLLADPFHADRWDYLFMIRRQGAEPQRRNVVLRFEGEQLKTIDAPDLPSEREFVTAISTVKPKGEAPVLELTEEQRRALPAPAPQPAASAAEPTAPARSYPPLEPQ